jgi:hypothetical protein
MHAVMEAAPQQLCLPRYAQHDRFYGLPYSSRSVFYFYTRRLVMCVTFANMITPSFLCRHATTTV